MGRVGVGSHGARPALRRGAGRLIVLASRSPQRRALLAGLGLPFRVVAATVEEGEEPSENALAKAQDVVARGGVPEGGAVLGADTVVRFGERVLGKPRDASEADAMLAALSGETHVVESAIALVTADGPRSGNDKTAVTFREVSPVARAWYSGTGEWRDRAGGYAIQGRGAALVRRIDGDYTTVVGLPVAVLVDLLEEIGLPPWPAI